MSNETKCMNSGCGMKAIQYQYGCADMSRSLLIQDGRPPHCFTTTPTTSIPTAEVDAMRDEIEDFQKFRDATQELEDEYIDSIIKLSNRLTEADKGLATLQAKHQKVCGWYEKWREQIPAESRDELNDIYLKGGG